jgi:hypothetical protein
MQATYRFGLRASYTIAFVALLAACGFAPARVPSNAVIAASVPHAWEAVPPQAGANPTLVGVRFSSLDVELGDTWDGDIVTSTDVTGVVLHTTLFDIVARRTAPGRFRFVQYVIDDPAFIVRPYALDIIATGASGRSASLIVPFRLRGHGVPAAHA